MLFRSPLHLFRPGSHALIAALLALLCKLLYKAGGPLGAHGRCAGSPGGAARSALGTRHTAPARIPRAAEPRPRPPQLQTTRLFDTELQVSGP